MKKLAPPRVIIAALLLGIAAPVFAGTDTPRLVIQREGAGGAGPSFRRVRAVGTNAAGVASTAAARRPGLRSFPHDLHARGSIPRAPRPVRELLAEGILAAAQTDHPDTLRLAIFRLDFRRDTAGELSTTDGSFDLRGDVTGIPVDPPPHDRAYFEAHAEALSRYYQVQSYGTLVVEATVFPEDPRGSYHLDDLGAYGPWEVAQEEEIILKAEALVTDAILAVDVSGDVVFSDFDAFVVVHAGPDFQSDVNRDTPYDIPSFTLSLGDSITTSSGQVGKVLVLPETVSQDGYLGALNGVFAHEFGHILDLVDLYNIWNGIPQVGYWSLMDSGENIPAIIVDPSLPDSTTGSGYAEFDVVGAFPTSLDPWSKLQIFPRGTAPVLVEESWAENLEGTQVSPVIPVVPLDDLEYFLVENRALDLDGNGFPFVRQDDATGVFLGPEDDPDNPGAGGRLEYDAVLPGGGVLVWHIDDKFVQPGLAGPGDVNYAVGYRGVALEEADGIWDQGRINLGVPEDAFYLGNNTRFGPDTVPGSAANDGAWTGIDMEIKSAPERFMGVEITCPQVRAGWPVYLNPDPEIGLTAYEVAAMDVTGDGAREVVFALRGIVAGSMGLAVINADGSTPSNALAAPTSSRILPGLAVSDRFLVEEDGMASPVLAAAVNGGALLVYDPPGTDPGRVLPLNPTVNTPPALLDRPGSPDWILYGGRGTLFGVDGSGTGTLTLVSEEAGEGFPTAGPVVVPDARFGTDGPEPWQSRGTVAALAFPGGLVERFCVDPEPAGEHLSDFCGPYPRFSTDVEHLAAGHFGAGEAGPPQLAVVTADSVAILPFQGGEAAAWPLPDGVRAARPPVLGDLDGDGLTELVLALEDGTLAAWNGDGSPVVGWPRTAAAPIRDLKLVDLDGDGRLDLFVLDGTGRFRGFDPRGQLLPGYPRALGGYAVDGSWIEDLDGDGRLTWLAASGNAVLAVRLPGAQAVPGDWRMRAGRPEGTWYQGRPAEDLARADEPDLGSDRLLIYPNPARGDGVEIRFTLAEGETADLRMLDLTGREFDGARLDRRGGYRTGENAVRWDVSGVAAGLYFCRLERTRGGDSAVDMARIVVMR